VKLYQRVLEFLKSPQADKFEPLALEVFSHQFSSLAPYREFCTSLGLTPENVHTIHEIPAVSTAAFKYLELRVGPPERVFVTSGTSRGKERRGRHFMPCLELYKTSALMNLRRMLFPDGLRLRMLALHPTAELMPESSLSQMISWCIEKFGQAPSICAATRTEIDLDRARAFLEDCVASQQPVCLLGTTAALRLLVESLRDTSSPLSLPQGSRIMDTGGAKGQANPIDSRDFIELCRRWLGVDPDRVINEYGMTEMSSQLYDATAFNVAGLEAGTRRRLKLPPPWLHVSAVDPVTLKPMPEGEPGLLKFFDLANAASVSALLTEDIGFVECGYVQILGRATLSEPRGCALSVASLAANT